MISVTKLFEWLSRDDNFVHERHEIASPAFGKLRRSLGSIIRSLRQAEDREAAEIANSMRAHLFTWLTSPVVFDSSIGDALGLFGHPDTFEERWGFHQGEFVAAIDTAKEMTSETNPLRTELIEVIRTLRAAEKSLKIFCHRKAREHFYSLELAPRLEDSSFLHSVRDYAAADEFDALIKVGPLRSRGWGAVPDAIKSAPKFEKLIQLVWSGCADDPGFGYDPVRPSGEPLDNQIKWKLEIKSRHDRNTPPDYDAEQDEFSSLDEPVGRDARRRAILLEIPGGKGILHPRTAILSFAPDAAPATSVGLRVPGESLWEGMFVIQIQLAEKPFGETQVQKSNYCRIWKQQLSEELQTSPDAFCRTLRNNGLNLKSLRNRVEDWAREPDTVIPAPQQGKHFQILIAALDIDPIHTQPTEQDTRPWWLRAWDEIRVSRGEAIQTGRQEHELVEQQALVLLKSLLPQIHERPTEDEQFRLPIPRGRGLCGAFDFFKVLGIEEDFLAPDTEIKVVRDLNRFEQWKVT
ncbi:MAG: hypothetical protein KA236_02915 [Verrucomicrobia bacterium]|jgi:hypothetical protein|nr:hypothetical protein [Verrucomicrobiota bacterium]